MNLLSIQSHVAYGHVGNSAAVFPLQRIGIEVWPVHTVQLSNHTGYGSSRGEAIPAHGVRSVISGIEERGILGECDGVLSGYLGTAEVGEVILDAVARVKTANPAARYCCDPVIGSYERGVYVGDGIPEFIRERALAAADIVTPNQFELECLTGGGTANLAEVVEAVDRVHALGPRVVLVTSMAVDDTPEDAIENLVSGPSGRFRLRTPKLEISANGAGDALAALFLAHHLRTGSAATALCNAASSLFGVLAQTAEAGASEMLLVTAQDEFVQPRRLFEAQKV
jgi:pyridoxine kinase